MFQPPSTDVDLGLNFEATNPWYKLESNDAYGPNLGEKVKHTRHSNCGSMFPLSGRIFSMYEVQESPKSSLQLLDNFIQTTACVNNLHAIGLSFSLE